MGQGRRLPSERWHQGEVGVFHPNSHLRLSCRPPKWERFYDPGAREAKTEWYDSTNSSRPYVWSRGEGGPPQFLPVYPRTYRKTDSALCEHGRCR
jgi:hypothetical protein